MTSFINDIRFEYIPQNYFTIFDQGAFLFQQISTFLDIYPGNTDEKTWSA